MSDRTFDPTTLTGLGAAARTVFSQTAGLVAVTAGLFALGAYVGRDLTHGWAWVFFIAAFASLIAMRYAARRQNASGVGLPFVFGLLIGLATAPTVAYYASTNPQAVWEAGGATALFITARSGRLREPQGSLHSGAGVVLGARRPYRLRHRGHLHGDPQRVTRRCELKG